MGPALLLILGFACFSPNLYGEEDAERARHLRVTGVIRPLEFFLRDAQKRHPGRLIEAKLEYEEKHGSYVYEIFLLDRRGWVWELEYDACTGVLIEIEREGDAGDAGASRRR